MTLLQITLIILIVLYGSALIFIFLYSLTQANLVYRYLRYKKKKPEETPEIPKEWPHVTIQLPVYNELYVVERLIDAAVKLDYPKELLEIQLLDDSDDASVELIQHKVAYYREQGIDIKQMKRAERKGFKAGALKYGLNKAKGEFLAIFDADFIPDSQFLKKTVPFFQNDEVGMVQTRWSHINKKYSLLTFLQSFALDAHFTIEQVGRNQKSCFINFNGTGGIWRKSCIEDAGNWEDDTLTEDLDLSYRAQLKGWKFKYLEHVCSPSELPPVMSALKSQQYRWTKGGAETAKKHIKAIWNSDIKFNQKWHGIFHLLNSTVFISVILAAITSIPLLFLKSYWPAVDQLFWVASVFFLSFIVISALYFISFAQSYQNKWGALIKFLLIFPLFLSVSMGLSFHNALAVMEGYLGKKSAFIRTPKFDLKKKGDSWNNNLYLRKKISIVSILEMLFTLYFAAGVWVAIYTEDYGLLPFHLMLSLGFMIITFYTFSQNLRIKRHHK